MYLPAQPSTDAEKFLLYIANYMQIYMQIHTCNYMWYMHMKGRA